MGIVIGVIIAVILLIFLTGKKRRRNAITREIYALVRSGRQKNILHDIFFEAALKFALEHGGKLEHGQSAIYTNSINFRMNIDGTNYLVYFSKNSDGSTYIGIDDADEMKKEFQKKVEWANKINSYHNMNRGCEEYSDSSAESKQDCLEEQYNACLQLNQKGEHRKAFELLLEIAENNYIDAQFALGVMLALGKGVQKNSNQAVSWFMRAAEQGHIDAQSALGDMYYNGNGVAKDYGEAAKWFKKSAKQDDANSQFYLGTMYLEGKGVKQDFEQAILLFSKSANQGHANSQTNLGVMYAEGLGTQKDYISAVKWFSLAAKQGNSAAREALIALKKVNMWNK